MKNNSGVQSENMIIGIINGDRDNTVDSSYSKQIKQVQNSIIIEG